MMTVTYHLSPADLIAQSDLTDLAQDATEWRLLSEALHLDAAATHTGIVTEIHRLRRALLDCATLIEFSKPDEAMRLATKALDRE